MAVALLQIKKNFSDRLSHLTLHFLSRSLLFWSYPNCETSESRALLLPPRFAYYFSFVPATFPVVSIIPNNLQKQMGRNLSAGNTFHILNHE